MSLGFLHVSMYPTFLTRCIYMYIRIYFNPDFYNISPGPRPKHYGVYTPAGSQNSRDSAWDDNVVQNTCIGKSQDSDFNKDVPSRKDSVLHSKVVGSKSVLDF